MSTSRSMATRALARVAVVGLIAAGAIVGLAPEVHAGTCWDTGCDGQDPRATGCDQDAYTLTSADTYFTNPSYGSQHYAGTAIVRFSPSCQAQWTLIYVPDGSLCRPGARLVCPQDAQIYRWSQGGYGAAWAGVVHLGDPGAGDYWSWSGMVGAAGAQAWSHACVVFAPGYNLNCADLYA